MRTYILHSSVIAGEIILLEREDGSVVCDFTKSGSSTQQQIVFLQVAASGMAAIRATMHEGSRLVEVKATFEMFWERYDDKLNSSRKRTLAAWNRMTEANRQRAYDYITTYFLHIPNGTRKKYAETYLNAELWNNHIK